MKKNLLMLLLLIITLCTSAQVKKNVKATTSIKTATKFGALAIDRNNGFYYGWSNDYQTLAEAEKKAVDECVKKGGNCTIVLTYSGTGCAAYRTVDAKNGTAFGWGTGTTKEQADEIAVKECLKRSNNINLTNFVFSCNSTNSGILKEIYNASSEIITSVKIGNQEWSTQNIKVTRFQNGDPIPQAKTKEQWIDYLTQGKPAYMDLQDFKEQSKCGYQYNTFAVNDKRGLAPKGWIIPSVDDYKLLVNYLGGDAKAPNKLMNDKWKAIAGNNSSQFNACPCDFSRGGFSPSQDFGYRSGWWTTTKSAEQNKANIFFTLESDNSGLKCDYWEGERVPGCYIRCIKQL